MPPQASSTALPTGDSPSGQELIAAAPTAEAALPRLPPFTNAARDPMDLHPILYQSLCDLFGCLGLPEPRELAPELARSVDPKVFGVDLSQLHLQCFVPYATGRSRALPCGVVRLGGDLQFTADRLDPEALAAGLAEAGDFGSRGSSSRAKQTEAAFRISLALLSSRFSRSTCRSRSGSPVVSPARAPSRAKAGEEPSTMALYLGDD